MKSLFLLSIFVAQSVFAVSTLPVVEVAQGIYVHYGAHEFPDKKNHGSIANIGFIIGNKCVAVIDTGGNPSEGYALKRTIKKLTSIPICYVINTHVHPDHIYGNIAFKKEKVKFVGHVKLARSMSVRGNYYIDKANEQLGLNLTEKHIILPDLAVKKQLVLDLGGREIVVEAHPTAHTDNDVTVFDRQTNTLWMSDLLFIDHLPVLDGSLLGWLNELKRMEKIPYQLVIPGHGKAVTNWPASLMAEKEYLQILLTGSRGMIKRGIFLEEAVKKVGYSENDKWVLFDKFHKRNVTSAFAELEWEE